MKKTVLFAAAEGLPFIKSGGLADVVGSLPQSEVKQGYEVRVVLPLYQKIINNWMDKLTKVKTFEVNMGIKKTVATVYQLKLAGITYYFIEHQGYFERDGMYGYGDDGERFAFFDLAVVQMLKELKYYPSIIHSHDWHTGMIPLLTKYQHKDEPKYQKIKHVYTIHNLLFQGNFPPAMLESCLNLPSDLYYNGSLRFKNDISFMKAGILYADKISTVSNTYAHEILTGAGGEGMDPILNMRAWDLWGITNGIDTTVWNPKTDADLNTNYDVSSLELKKENKRQLQEELGLRVDDHVLLLGMVSRLTWQKGIYLLIQKMYEVMGQDVQLVILGTGESNAENQLKPLEYNFPHRAVYYCGYNEPLSHRIYAGVDCFLMPSIFEPCGISQLISMHYGTLPLVRETGGLKDTVIPYNQFTKEGTGFTFKNPDGDDFLNMVKYACYVYYYRHDDWTQLQVNAMNNDVSWDKSCQLYCQLYESLIGNEKE